MEELSKLSEEVLRGRLQKMSAELEELEEEQGYVLRQTGLHLPGYVVKKFEADVRTLKESLAALRDELERRNLNSF